MDCIFCKIVAKEIPTNFIYEDENVVVFLDIKPSAPIHYLVVPKKHIQSVRHLANEDKELVSDVIYAAKIAAEELHLSGYKLVFNVGREGGQVIDHLHLHLLGGWSVGSREIDEMPHPEIDK
ncbi:MAG: histidine triad nucleotide-binding protein [Patescibacteria group bacterium]